MPCATDFSAPIRLRLGAGRATIAALYGLSLVPGFIACSASPAPPAVRAAWLLALCVAYIAAVYLAARRAPGTLVIDAHCQGQFAPDGQEGERVELATTHWLSHGLSIVRVVARGQTRGLLVLRGRQAQGNYRRMLVRLRHQALLR